ncbi:MAG TPA: methyltransferase domain-containing protein, partial [Fimbriimonas sp.]|nr:methyltransferase domain-containing protein [Fimbriimonas sp.]
MAFKDLFSEQSALYAQARPRYPKEVFEFISAQAPSQECAWDCGTGNGQAAVSLAKHFQSVYASDPSSEQIANAIPDTNVRYSIQPAEQTDFPDGIFAAVCVAQA